MNFEWVTIPDFENYLISNYGDVVNKHTGRSIKKNRTLQGAVKVGLMRGGVQHTRSVKVLVAEIFVEGQDDIYDTPIQLDGNQQNLRADNLAWRPRWFAIDYFKQFVLASENDQIGPLKDNNGNFYRTVYEAGTLNGLLFKDIRKSIITGEFAFPTFLTFEFT